MKPISLTPRQLLTLQTLIRLEVHRIEEHSPDAITKPNPGSWADELHQLGRQLEAYPYGPGF